MNIMKKQTKHFTSRFMERQSLIFPFEQGGRWTKINLFDMVHQMILGVEGKILELEDILDLNSRFSFYQ